MWRLACRKSTSTTTWSQVNYTLGATCQKFCVGQSENQVTNNGVLNEMSQQVNRLNNLQASKYNLVSYKIALINYM